jgi:hypothetical protein
MIDHPIGIVLALGDDQQKGTPCVFWYTHLSQTLFNGTGDGIDEQIHIGGKRDSGSGSGTNEQHG